MQRHNKSIIITTISHHVDGTTRRPLYSEKSLTQTATKDDFDSIMLPSGHLVLTMIGPFEGYNQEDSIITNQSGVDHSLFRSYVKRTVKKLNEVTPHILGNPQNKSIKE